MVTKFYVGNLDCNVTDDNMKKLFSNFGCVNKTKIFKDYKRGASQCFAFVEMKDNIETAKAVLNLDGSTFQGRTINVLVAKT